MKVTDLLSIIVDCISIYKFFFSIIKKGHKKKTNRDLSNKQ